MSKSKKFPRYTTPVGVAVFPRLTSPDTKFDPDGVYHTKLRFDPSAIADMRAKVQQLAQEKFDEVVAEKPKYKKLAKIVSPFKAETDDEGEETGKIVANFKMKAEVTTKEGKKYTFKPALFDAAGKPTKANPWSGSELKVNFEMVPYFNESDKEAGVSLRMYAVQIIKLVEGGRDAESFGFGVEEGGWTDDGETTEEVKNKETGTDNKADGDEDDADF